MIAAIGCWDYVTSISQDQDEDAVATMMVGTAYAKIRRTAFTRYGGFCRSLISL